MIARGGELRAVERFVAAGADHAAVLVLEGEPGMGKTTLWEAAIGAAREGGVRVLTARTSGAEAQLSFTGLTDLLEGVDEPVFGLLPAPQRLALDVALLRSSPTEEPPEPRAIGLGLLNVLRALAGLQPVLIAIDDLQWLDAASSTALSFAARRLDGEAVSFLLARRPGGAPELERALERHDPERLHVGPLGLTATGRLLHERLGVKVRRATLRRIVEVTRGNPLFVLELGRTFREHGPPGPGEDLPVPDVVEDLLGARVARLPDRVRRLLLAVALGGDLPPSQLSAIGEPGAVDAAVEAGVLVANGGVRASHPLLAAAARQRSTAREQRELHLALATVVEDEELRAFHLALATDSADDDLAKTVAAAASAAAARGASHDAVVLAEHALRLTADPEERTGRLLALAGHLDVAGEQERLTGLLEPQLDALPEGEPRVRACLFLTNGAVETSDDVRRFQQRALAESAGNARLRAMVLADIAAHDVLTRVENISKAEAWAAEAVVAGRVADPEVERAALYALSWARSLRGTAVDDLCERFRELTGGPGYFVFSPDRAAGQRVAWRGDVREARSTLVHLLSVADERGEPISYALQRLHLCELEVRSGAWDEAEGHLDEWLRGGELQMWPAYDRCRALLAAGRGLPEEAERLAGQAIEAGRRTSVRWDILESLRARGLVALLAGDPARAAESLGAVWDHTQREGVDEPGAFPVAPDLVEALVALDRLDEARAVAGRLRRLAEEQEHPWGLATAKRCDGLIRLASPSGREEGTQDLDAAAAAYGELGLRFDRARSLLALGRGQRRLRQWAAARESLERAAACFRELGSPGWAELADSELARVGGRPRRATGELTPAQRRTAELAAQGLSNKEIAQQLVVTVRTVEEHLKHVYAKLGVRSRAQLARRLPERV